MAFLNGSGYTGAQYFSSRYMSFQGATVIPTADSPQTIIVNIVVTPVPQPPVIPAGTGRVFLSTWGRPRVVVLGRIPDPPS